MNKEIVNEWVTALRSGEYSQTRKKLRTNEGYCCLGVLCELAVKHGVIPPPEKDSRNGAYRYEGEKNYLPESVRAWVGLNSSSGLLNGTRTSLWRLNDYESKTFEEIASFIESNPKGLFVEEV